MNGPYGILQESIEDYHANPAWSNTKLKTFRLSRFKAFQLYVSRTRTPTPSKPAQVFGNCVHTGVLEPAEFDKRYLISPYDNFRTLEAREWRQDKEAAGVSVLTQEDYDRARACIDHVRADPLVQVLLSKGRAEVVFRKKLPRFDIQTRVDWYEETGVVLPMGEEAGESTGSYFCELKTLTDTTQSGDVKGVEEMFEYSCLKYGYYEQVTWAREVIAELLDPTGENQVRPAVYFIAVQSVEPFNVIVCQPKSERLAIATRQIRADLRRISNCYQSGIWNGVIEIGELTRWEKYELRQANRLEIVG